MSRKTVYHSGIASEEKWKLVLDKNKILLNDFLDYCEASNKSPQTKYQYEQQLRIFFVFVCEQCENKYFIDLKKRDLIKFANWLVNNIQASPNRVSSLKSAISSLSKYVEKVLDDEYPTFRNLTSVIEIGGKQPVREKNVFDENDIQECLEKLTEDKKYQMACCLSLMFNSGARISEVVQFKVNDFENIALHSEEFGDIAESHVMRTKGKGKLGKQISRFVFMKDFKQYLDKYMDWRKENGIKNEYLFVTYRDGDWEPAKQSQIRSWFSKIEKVMGRNINPHAMRHAALTFLKRQGVPDSVLQKFFKWENISMVEVYSDITDTEELSNYFSR